MTAQIRKFEQRGEWETDRNTGIGGSDAPVILRVDERKSLMELFLEKRGQSLETPFWKQKVYERGHRHEVWIAEDYEADYGRKLVDHGLHSFVSSDVPWHRCSIDREITAPVDGFEGPGVLEAKSMVGMTRQKIEDDTPLTFVIQLQHNLSVLQWGWGSIAVMNPISNRMVKKDIERNDRFISAMLAEEDKFWWFVEHNKLPPVDFTESCTKALGTLFPEDSDRIVDLGTEFISLSKRLKEVKGQMKELREQESLLKNQFRIAMEDAAWAKLPNGEWYSLRKIHKPKPRSVTT